ncbi:MAG: hypothetical protein HZC28_06070 [Spirochaetes bacterium]|nr:hypothetical protein [Spirochaetota bacterium]
MKLTTLNETARKDTGMKTDTSSPKLTQRQTVLRAMELRPADPWPRGTGHVPLGIPGSPIAQKGYHEPGGSFSPAPGSFGISVWVIGNDGKRIATSDDIPLEEITQRYVWTDSSPMPSLVTETPYYKCTWSLDAGRWTFELEKRAADNSIAILIRSVGPTGGPVESLHTDERQIIINHRWVVSLEQSVCRVYLGDEETPGWQTAMNQLSEWTGANGWGYARLILSADASRLTLTVRDTAPQFRSPLTFSTVKTAIELDIPDKKFAASLNAQAANLMMGFIGKQTCPGEPINYPLAWERDGAYSVVAMARCGQMRVAMDLAEYFAENDFFGGFGAEGDAPGSTINAIVTVAILSGDRDFQERMWPHVQRKTRLIAEMLDAKKPLYKPWIGPIVPAHIEKDCIPVICQPEKDGLIIGSMDLHYPALYINAFSYRGLMQAKRLADVLGKPKEADEFTQLAQKIRNAWLAHFEDKEYYNERTFMSALWPTWVIDTDFAPFQNAIASRWEKIQKHGTYPTRPLWTYFTAAEAHQWLFIDRPDYVWKTLEYFFRNQCSPGLFTYWEGKGEENSFGGYENIRGWVNPPHVTPHYWTAAEMLLLQIDMLTYVNEAGDEPVLVIGGGVPSSWLKHTLTVNGVNTSVGKVDWMYRNNRIDVRIHGTKKCRVRAGTGFSEFTEIHVTMCSPIPSN